MPNCNRCGTDNDASAQFCKQCGSPLSALVMRLLRQDKASLRRHHKVTIHRHLAMASKPNRACSKT